MKFQSLKKLSIFLDDVFQSFYDELLSNETFQSYFKDEAQIQHLLAMQKKNFSDSLDDSSEEFKVRFLRLGKIHFDVSIPYEAFIAGAKILNREFVSKVVENNIESLAILEVNEYFNQSIELMAKGYLIAFIESDKKNIDKILETIRNDNSDQEKALLIEHYQWLRDLFHAIEISSRAEAPNLDLETSNVYQLILSFEQNGNGMIGDFDIEYIRKIYTRIYNSSKNIFYFIERDIYTEALSLFVSLLEIYKFTLMFSNIITTAINDRMEKSLEYSLKMAEEDPLTGLLNRRKLCNVLQYGIEESLKEGNELSLVFVDIDYFKSINDNYGHSRGDFVLKTFAKILTKSARKNDILFRFGGEEFLFLCFNTDYGSAKEFAEKIRADVERYIFEGVGQVTASFGVATYDGEEDKTRLVERADEMLYKAKNSGRNRVN